MGQPEFRREWGNRDSGVCCGIHVSRGYDNARVRLSMSRPAEPGYSGLRRANVHVDVVTPECHSGPCVCHGAVLACRCNLQVDVRCVYYVESGVSTPERGNLYSGVSAAIGIPVCVVLLSWLSRVIIVLLLLCYYPAIYLYCVIIVLLSCCDIIVIDVIIVLAIARPSRACYYL